MKLINRDKFNLVGHNDAVQVSKEDPTYGMVYNSDFNLSRMNPIEFLWFSSEMRLQKPASIWWFLAFLLCPLFPDFRFYYRDIKKYGILNLSFGDVIGILLITLFTVTLLGPVFGIVIAICKQQAAKKYILKYYGEEELHKEPKRNTDN